MSSHRGRRRRTPPRRPRWRQPPPRQLLLDIFLPDIMDEYHDKVWDALYQLHMEKGCNRSFRPEEVAVRAGLRKADVERILWRLWKWGMLVKRRNNRYKIRDGLIKTCYQLAALRVTPLHPAEEA